MKYFLLILSLVCYSSAFANSVLKKSVLAPFIDSPNNNHYVGFDDGYEQMASPPYSFTEISGEPNCYKFAFNDEDGNVTRKVCLQKDENGFGSKAKYYSGGNEFTLDKVNILPPNCKYQEGGVELIKIDSESCSKQQKICVGTLGQSCGSYAGLKALCESEKGSDVCKAPRDCAASSSVNSFPPRGVLSSESGSSPTLFNPGGTGTIPEGGNAGPGR